MNENAVQRWLENAKRGITEGKPHFVLASATNLRKLGKNDLVEKVLREAHDVFSDNLQVFRALATSIIEKDPQEGLEFADANTPSFGVQARFQRALALAKLGQVPEALREIEDILRKEPQQKQDRFIVVTLFALYNREGRFQEARSLLEPLIDQGIYTDVRIKQELSTVLCKLRQSLPKVLELLGPHVDTDSEKLKKLAREIMGEIVLPPEPPKSGGPRVFISHSSEDKKVATALVEFLEAALQLEPSEIRCTSVPGYMLPTGAHTSTHLRDEIRNAEVIIGVVTTNSIQSSYVLFELGASWGFKKATFPLLARGAAVSSLPGPLREQHASRLHVSTEIYQVIDDLVRSTTIQRRTGIGAKLEVKAQALLAAALEDV